MAILSELAERVEALSAMGSLDVEATALADAMRALGDEVVDVVAAASAARSVLDRVVAVGAAVIAERSTPELGRSGLAATKGHRSPVDLVQSVTGTSKTDARRAVRVGSAVIETTAPVADAVDVPAEQAPRSWHAPADEALLSGALTATQHDAIVHGLGSPVDGGEEAWMLAAERLVSEAPLRTVEELRKSARVIRDLLDADDAERGFDERFAQRSFRSWTTADGRHRALLEFDDEAWAWINAIIDSAMRPRRGGPRFVDPDEKKRADDLIDDPRTNEQLAYDLLMDTLRAGALADAEQVFGTRQAGVRVITVVEKADAEDADAGSGAGAGSVGIVEDEGTVLPAWLVAQRQCDTATSEATIDADGNPLYLGREARLFSAKQKVALAVRDGGCRWRECDRPASYCEAHHCDEWWRDKGRTDVDRGILLCRWHHMQLHHGGWRITRDGLGEFMLHPPDGSDPIALPPRLRLRYLWGDIDPPPRRFRPAA